MLFCADKPSMHAHCDVPKIFGTKAALAVPGFKSVMIACCIGLNLEEESLL